MGVRHVNQAPIMLLAISAMLAIACHDSPSAPTALSAPALTGIVNDTFGEPISGARVEIVGGPLAGRATLTTSAGRFSIQIDGASPLGMTLRVSSEGFSSVTHTVAEPAVVVIVLESTASFALQGNYTLTIAAADACAGIPTAFRSRTYDASLRRRGASGRAFTVALAGADFYPGYGTLFGNTTDSGATFWISSWEAFDNWLEEQPIFERLASSAYISLVGSATTTAATSDRMSLLFEGSFGYCAASRPNGNPLWPPVCTVPPVECQSNAHRFTLVRR